jgi:hypothetical protein
MWDFISEASSQVTTSIDRYLHARSISLGSKDDWYGLYTITEAAGYVPPEGGIDFMRTYEIALSLACFMPWGPPKLKIETEFIEKRRKQIFEGASMEPRARMRIAARVNRAGFDAVKSGNRSLRPFDLFNFAE